MKGYLLDTNYLIYLNEENADAEKRKEILQEFAEKLGQENSRFFLTPLIRYEILRGVTWQDSEKLQKLSAALMAFESLEITKTVADLADDLYRFDRFDAEQKNQKKNLEKIKFDVFHYATAHIHHLEILSRDDDVDKIKAMHERMNMQSAQS